MNEHVDLWLSAYHDGELSPRWAQQVEKHLAACQNCRRPLAQLRNLSVLLGENLLPEGLMPADVFAARVAMRLPRTIPETLWAQALKVGWQAAPFGVLAVWAFVQTVFLVAGLLVLALNTLPGGGQVAVLLGFEATGARFDLFAGLGDSGLLGYLGQMFGDGGPLGWAVSLNLSLTILIGLLYWSWLASWWIQLKNGIIHSMGKKVEVSREA
jgi:hypothetical protein